MLNSLCWFNAEPLIRLFRDDPEVTAVALPALRYQCVAMFLQPVIIVTNMMFQSIGKSGRATFLACCRQGVCFIPLILTLPRIWGLSGIELCQPIADGLTFCISVPFLLPFLKELKIPLILTLASGPVRLPAHRRSSRCRSCCPS